MIYLFLTGTEADQYLATNIFRNYQFDSVQNDEMTESLMLDQLNNLDYTFTSKIKEI